MRLTRKGRGGRPTRASKPGASVGGGGGFESLTAAIADSSPIAYLKLDDAAAPYVDYGSRAVNGSWSGTLVTAQDVAGPDGANYVRFSGGNISLADAPDLGIDYTFGKTFVCAFRPTTFADRQSLFSKLGGSSGERDYGLFSVAAGSAVMGGVLYQPTTAVYSKYEIQPGDVPIVNQWNFLVWRANTDGTQDMWLNSATGLTLTVSQAVTGTPGEDGSYPLHLGSLPDYAGYRLTGAMGHFAIFDSALDDTTCEGIMQAAIDEGWTA